ncbi:MAG: hypothetical protein L0Z54_06815, partial [Thermoplasmata archaeon]|nr:hypothetical protein [Thermoplasmata archaeon]
MRWSQPAATALAALVLMAAAAPAARSSAGNPSYPLMLGSPEIGNVTENWWQNRTATMEVRYSLT